MDRGDAMIKRTKPFGRYITLRSIWNVIKARLSFLFIHVSAVTLSKLGIDISKWNWPMDFTITNGKVEFIFIRGGYGWFDDTYAYIYINECEKYNIPYGIYWYLWPGDDLQKQLDAFVACLQEYNWSLPPVADFEQTKLEQLGTTNWIREFMAKLQSRVSQKVMIYTSPGFWNSKVLRNDWAKKYYLWVAHWTTALEPILPADWDRAVFWQRSANGNGKGPEYGSGGDRDMDINFFTGTLTEWASWVTEEEKPPPEPDNPVLGQEFTSLFGDLYKRDAPIIGKIVGYRQLGEKVQAAEYQLWIQDVDGNWSAVHHNGKDYMSWE